MELILAFLVWLGQMPAPPPPPPRVALAEPARAASQLAPRILGGSGWVVGEDQGDQSTGTPPPDPPVPIVAFCDDRADADQNGHPGQDQDWEGFLNFGLCGARAGFDRIARLPLSSEQAKWLYRAWGQP
jgi:hypothetical protein